MLLGKQILHVRSAVTSVSVLDAVISIVSRNDDDARRVEQRLRGRFRDAVDIKSYNSSPSLAQSPARRTCVVRTKGEWGPIATLWPATDDMTANRPRAK